MPERRDGFVVAKFMRPKMKTAVSLVARAVNLGPEPITIGRDRAVHPVDNLLLLLLLLGSHHGL